MNLKSEAKNKWIEDKKLDLSTIENRKYEQIVAHVDFKTWDVAQYPKSFDIYMKLCFLELFWV